MLVDKMSKRRRNSLLEYEDLTQDTRFEDRETDEDTEDASETEVVKQEEELFQEKIASLKRQLQQVVDGSHSEYQKRLKKIELAHQERCLLNEVWRQCEMDRVKGECEAERRAATKELQEKTIELKESLLSEYEEKRRQVEVERNTIELTGDTLEVKSVTTRKLRRRPNDPVQPMTSSEKRRKVSPTQLNLLLDEGDIIEDLKILQRGKYGNVTQQRKGIIRMRSTSLSC